MISSDITWHKYHKEADALRASAMRSLMVSLSLTKFKVDASKSITLGISVVPKASSVVVMTGAMFATTPSSVSNHNLRVRHSGVGRVCHLTRSR